MARGGNSIVSRIAVLTTPQIEEKQTKQLRTNHLLNPSKEARTISPGIRLKNFLPTLEFTIGLVKNPETFTTPVRIPRATPSDIFVNFLTLQTSRDKIMNQCILLNINLHEPKRGEGKRTY